MTDSTYVLHLNIDVHTVSGDAARDLIATRLEEVAALVRSGWTGGSFEVGRVNPVTGSFHLDQRGDAL